MLRGKLFSLTVKKTSLYRGEVFSDKVIEKIFNYKSKNFIILQERNYLVSTLESDHLEKNVKKS